jgi:hypothetical protein
VLAVLSVIGACTLGCTGASSRDVAGLAVLLDGVGIRLVGIVFGA